MFYAYIALNTENQKLKGVIAANSEQQAKKKLHQVGLSILSLRETDKKESQSVERKEENNILSSLESFTFWVIDPQGKKLSGKIEAKDRKNALKRLAQEYGFEILSLCSTTVPEDQQYTEGQKDLRFLEEEIEEEFGIQFKHSNTKEKQTNKNDIHNKAFREEQKEIQKEIEMVSSKTQEILDTHQNKIPAEEYDKTRDLLGQINRLRFSNNFILIRKLIEDLFSEIDSIMNKYILTEDNKDYAKQLREKELFDDTLSQWSKIPQKDVIGKLKNFSKSLDVFLGHSQKSKKRRKKTESEEHLLTEAIEDALFFRRILKSLFTAFFTQNTSLRKQRITEVKKKFKLWKKAKKQKARQREEARARRRKERESHQAFISKQEKFFLFIMNELHIFLGSILFVLFCIGYVTFLIDANHITLSNSFFIRLTQSQYLPSIAIGTFFLFFSISMQRKFFHQNIYSALIFLFFTFLVWILYFYNL